MKAEELRIGNYIQNIMKAEELRIGNYVYEPESSDPKPFKVWGTYQEQGNDKVNGYPIALFQPIPLTEEWLIKFGFEDGKKQLFEDYILEVSINAFSGTLTTAPKWFVGIIRIASNDRITLVKNNVHQLQNLYFALTQKELTIK